MTLLVTVLLAACVAPPETQVDRTVEGPVATAAAVSIGYPDDAASFGLGASVFESRWEQLAVVPLGAPAVTRVGEEAVASGSAVAVDVVVEDGEVLIAQLTVVNAAGDDDEGRAASLIEAFVAAVVDGDPFRTVSDLGFGPDGGLFIEQAITTVPGRLTFFRASNEDTILVGVVGSP